MKISELMRKKFLSLQIDETIVSAATKMAQNQLSEVPVLNGWKFVGMFRLSDLANAILKTHLFERPTLRNVREVRNQTIRKYIKAKDFWLKPDSDILSLFIYLKRQNAKIVPVVDQEMRLAGVVYISDVRKEISKLLLDGQEDTVQVSSNLKEPENLDNQTPIDQLVHLVEKRGFINAADAARICGLSHAEIQDYAKSLEKNNLIRIEYGLFGMKLIKPKKPGQGI
jgi:predicted transcriptional regulator